MGWLGQIIENIKGADPVTFTFVDDLPDPGLGVAGLLMEPDCCYVELYVESLRLERARRFATSFHGLAYSFVRLSQLGAEDAELAAVSKPAGIATIDPANFGRVITLSNRMMGAVPWRGGSLGLELGLFSVKAGNLLAPWLDYVADVSTTGGVSFIGQVKPFLPLITRGMDLIAGQTEETVIEVALDTDMALERSKFCAIIAAPQETIDRTRLSIDHSTRALLLDGRPYEGAYCVFSIRRSTQKADFGAIPDLKVAWGELRQAIVANDKMKADAALAAFVRTAVISPDLIPDDADRLSEQARAQVKRAFPVGPVMVSRARDRGIDIGALDQIALYKT